MKNLTVLLLIVLGAACQKTEAPDPVSLTKGERFKQIISGHTWDLVRYSTTLNGKDWFRHPFFTPDGYYIKFYENDEFTYFYSEGCKEGYDYGVTAQGSYYLALPNKLVFDVSPNSNNCLWLQLVTVVAFSEDAFIFITEDDSLFYEKRKW